MCDCVLGNPGVGVSEQEDEWTPNQVKWSVDINMDWCVYVCVLVYACCMLSEWWDPSASEQRRWYKRPYREADGWINEVNVYNATQIRKECDGGRKKIQNIKDCFDFLLSFLSIDCDKTWTLYLPGTLRIPDIDLHEQRREQILRKLRIMQRQMSEPYDK